MTLEINDQQFENINALPAAERYEHWIKRVADQGDLWSLWDKDSWAMVETASGRKAMPVWSHSRYATAYATGHLANCQPKRILLESWMKEWLHDLGQRGVDVAIFPVLSSPGIVAPPQRVKDDLEYEMSKFL